jgi:hypothetical protein
MRKTEVEKQRCQEEKGASRTILVTLATLGK